MLYRLSEAGRGGAAALAAAMAAGFIFWALAACAVRAPTLSPTALPSPRVETKTTPTPPTRPAPVTGCNLPTVIAPTVPVETPGFAALDPITGLHVTGVPQTIDLASYRLEVSGKVDYPLQLTYDELRCLPKVEARVTLICQGYFEDTATWAGVSIKEVLALAGVQAGASSLRLTSADGYGNSVLLSVTDSESNFLAYELEGKTLPVWHGFPLRAVFPNLPGNTWVKWLVRLEVE